MATSRTASCRPSIRLSPIHSRENSRSTSPDRNPTSLYQKIDPLLSNLSPESTLLALTTTEAVPANSNFSHNVLSQSISQVTPGERAVGIRAAIAAQNLNIWYKEIRSWMWPALDDAKMGAGFVPPAETPADAECASSTLHSDLPVGRASSSSEIEFYGSLPATLVEEYEKRIEEIRDGMDNLNVEELKEHVLNAHIPARSRPSSSTSSGSVPPPLSYVQLSDFTAVVTATILRALPLLSKLNSLLTTWDVRLLVLRQIPGLLRELKTTRHEIDSALKKLRAADTLQRIDSRQTDSHLVAEHGKIESAVVAVGRRMDRALDSLEGRPDSLPERWIDELESIESDFAAWSVEAERYRLRTKWLSMRRKQRSEEIIVESKVKDEIPLAMQIPDLQETANQSSQPEAMPELLSPIKEAMEDSELHYICDERDSRDFSYDRSKSPLQGEEPQPSIQEPDASLAIPSVSESKPTVPPEDVLTISNDLFDGDFQGPTEQAPLKHGARQLTAEDPSLHSQIPQTPQIPSTASSPCAFSHFRTPPIPEHSQGLTRLTDSSLTDCDPFIESTVALSGVGVKVVSPKDFIQSEGGHLADGHLPVSRENDDVSGTAQSLATSSLSLSPRQEPKRTPDTSETYQAVSSWRFRGRPGSAEYTPALPCGPFTNDTSVFSQDKPHPFSELQWKPTPLASSALNSDPGSTSAVAAARVGEEDSKPEPPTARKPLQSPIKLAKHRPVKLNISQDVRRPRQGCRRSSNGSSGSLLSENSSSLSSPEAPEPQTSSSHGDVLMTPSRENNSRLKPEFAQEGHSLRASHLLRLENPKPAANGFSENRAVSLQLERFINDEFDFDRHEQDDVDANSDRTHFISYAPGPSRPPRLARGKSASDLKDAAKSKKSAEHPAKVFGMNTAHRALIHQDQPKSVRLRQRLTAHPSLESLGVKRQDLPFVEEDEAEVAYESSRASSPLRRKPRDHLDEKIDSILSGLSGRIHLVDANHDNGNTALSVDRRSRCQSESPRGATARSTTPAPSMMLMPAARRRLSHVTKPEDSCVKLYHLHHGGQTAPTKLFVRTVGDENQRVMVRVGGGWADLGEYLREYLTHHGRRKVSETPRVEVQGLTAKTSPNYASPAAVMTPRSTSPYLTTGRVTPSRPPSVISARPASSLNVRKRRGSNVSEIHASRSVTVGAITSFISPPQALLSRQRRVSMSPDFSYNSNNDLSSPDLASNGFGHDSQPAPLGLAGPKPRSRHISMSPEGEAWVEDVLQQTRRSSSAHAPSFTLNSVLGADKANEVLSPEGRDRPFNNQPRRSVQKVSSVSDIRSVGASKQVSLRGLGNVR
ncbi:hypothetical protein N7539_004890 [Penicillium diatomitis]|uniref:GAR domain-containing protein n=1 Tax=Penicillium diatomitis TaxID=2819901 RepID=A0A9W9X606_9EURO|nr:uncharacterized protein N7539_004890 [Penicillium diatomitis]KAJ5484902.1 hypothetical protein N7539_004890 [Penicillium diatomitis]